LLEFRILGPLEVVGERGPIRLAGSRQRATLAILLLHANRVVSVDRIVEDLYADAAPVTALKQVQRQISELRKALGSPSTIETRSPGYVIHLSRGQLDLSMFERLAAEGADAFSAGDPHRAADLLRQALELWRGDPLADLRYESFAQASIERLQEIRLAALEQRIDADLALGRHAELVAELEELVQEHAVRERLHGQLMLSLYRSGRQAEALAAYRDARTELMDGFGIEPSPALKELERQMLAQDPRLEPAPGTSARPASSGRTTLAVPKDGSGVTRLGALARSSEHELIIARLVEKEPELEDAVALLEAARGVDGVPIRVAAFTSSEPAADIVRLASAYDVELVLIDLPGELREAIVTVLDESPADVGLVAGEPVDWQRGAGIFVPFGGTEHDWAALELGASLASVAEVPLRLVGVRADPAHGRRDASRLLANASVAVQRLVDVIAAPLLVEPTPDAVADAVQAATVTVVGLSARWRTEGVGTVRHALLSSGRPVVLVHAGPRPSGLAPRDARTRFTWSLAT
jgi:DNA-binding SARP family transcriptional activator